MTMTETQIPAAPKPARKQRRKRRASAPKAPAAPKAPDIYAGITANDCPIACTAAACVITGRGRCGQPCKGGLQGSEMHDPAVVQRFAEARNRLMHAAIDKKAK